jgi:hypothetical protein
MQRHSPDDGTNIRSSAPNQSPLATRRDSVVICIVCGRTVPRTTRWQRFCTPRCRMRHARAESQKNGRPCVFPADLGEDTGRVTHTPQKSNGFNGLQRPKSGSNPRIFGPARVIEQEVFGGRDWVPVTSPSGLTVLVAPRACRRPRP